MKKDHIKTYIIVAIFISIIGISIAYAALSQQLQIKTSTTVQDTKTSWNVKITNVSCSDNNYATHGEVKFTDTTVTISNIVLKVPYSYVGCNITIKNAGQIAAKFSGYTKTTPKLTGSGSTATEDVNLIKSHLIEEFKDVSTNKDMNEFKNELLAVGSTRVMRLVFGITNDLTTLPTNPVTISDYSHTINYIQA